MDYKDYETGKLYLDYHDENEWYIFKLLKKRYHDNYISIALVADMDGFSEDLRTYKFWTPSPEVTYSLTINHDLLSILFNIPSKVFKKLADK